MACGTGSGNFPQPGDPSNDSILSAAPAFGGIDVKWTFPNINPQAVAHVRLYRSTAGTAGSGVLHTLVNGDFFFDRIENATPIEYFYWIEVVSVNGTIGELIGPASAIARPPLEDYLELISGEITRGMLATALRTELDQLPLLNLRLLEEIGDRINGESIIGTSLNVIQDGIDGVGTLLNEEVVNRTTQYSALMQVINTLAASTGNTSGLIQQEATARADADEALARLITTLQAVVNDPISGLPVTYAAIRNESIVRASAIDAMAGQYSILNAAVTNSTTGLVASHSRITQEATARANAISAVNNVVTTLRSEIASPITGLPAAFAGLQQEAITRVSAVEALSSEYDALYAQVNNVTTGLPAAHAGILIESTARTTADLALAERLELLQAVVNHPVTGAVNTFGLISNEMRVRAEEDEVLAESINRLQAAMFSPLTGLHQAHSLIVEERTVRTTQYGTMAQQTLDLQSALNDPVTGLGAIYNSNNTKITTYFQSEEPEGDTLNNGDLWIDTNDHNAISRYNKPLLQWETAHDGRITTALSTANAALSTATSSFKSFFQDAAPTTGMLTGDFWFDTNDNNTAYRWNAGANEGAGGWVAAPDDAIAQALIVATTADAKADGKVAVFYQTEPPSSGVSGVSRDGDLWIDTNNQNIMNRYDAAANGGAGAWIAIRDGGIGEALGNAAAAYDALVDGKIEAFWQPTAPDPVYHATNNPTPPVLGIGDIWFDTNSSPINAPHRWNGTTWASAANSAIAAAFAAAASAQSTADGKIVTFYQANTPTAQAHGDLWVDTDEGNILKRWDPTANENLGAWVTVQDGAIGALEDTRIRTYYHNEEPEGTVQEPLIIGDLWVDTNANNLLHRWDGTTWISVQDGQIQTALGRNTVFYQGSNPPPTANRTGDIWFDTDDFEQPHIWDGDSWEEVEIATYNRVTARIRENNQTMVGYCQIGGNPDLTHTSPTACTAAGGTWLTAAPIAQSIKTAQITTVGGSGTIEEMMQVYEDDLDNINAQYTVKLQVNGTTGDSYIGGFGLMNSGTVVDAIFDVDNFTVGRLGSGATPVYPFMVQGAQVLINDAIIEKLTIDKLRSTDASLVFEDGKLQVDYIDIDNLIVSQAQSSNYTVPGAGGWLLENGGHAEFNDIIVYDPDGRLAFATGLNYLVAVDDAPELVNLGPMYVTPGLNGDFSRDGQGPWSSQLSLQDYQDSFICVSYDAATVRLRDATPVSLGVGTSSTGGTCPQYSCVGVSSRNMYLYRNAIKVTPGRTYEIKVRMITAVAPALNGYLRISATNSSNAVVSYVTTDQVVLTTTPESSGVQALAVTENQVGTPQGQIAGFTYAWQEVTLSYTPAVGVTWFSPYFVCTNRISATEYLSIRCDLFQVTELTSRVMVGTTYIRDAAIDTLKIRDGAVTAVSVAAPVDGSWANVSGAGPDRLIATMNFNHGWSEAIPILIFFSGEFAGQTTYAPRTHMVCVTHNTTISDGTSLAAQSAADASMFYAVKLTNDNSNAIYTQENLSKVIMIPPGDHVFRIYVQGASNGVAWRNVVLSAQGAKR